MPIYTVENPETGQRVKFDWTDVNPPTDADMEEVFAQSSGAIAPPPPAPLEGQAARRAALPEEPLTFGEVATGAIESAPESAAEFGEAITGAVTHPIETAKSVGQLVRGAGVSASDAFLNALGVPEADIAKMSPERKQEFEESEEARNAFSGFMDFMGERLGGVENVKRTIATDPVGFLADLSMLLSGGAGVAAKLGAPSQVVKGVAQVGRAADPVRAAATVVKAPAQLVSQVGGKAVKTVAEAPFKGALPKIVKGLSPSAVSERLYASAFKMRSMTSAERSALIKTGLTERVFPTKSSLSKIERRIDHLDKVVGNRIKKSAKGGVELYSPEVVKRLDDLEKFYKNQAIGGPEAVAEIQKIKADFIKERGRKIPVAEAHRIKQATNQNLRKSFGEKSNLQIEAAKQLARGLKEEVARLIPEVGSANLKASALIKFEEALEKTVGRLTNRDIVSLGSHVAVSGSKEGMMYRITLKALDSAQVKTALAVALHEATGLSKAHWLTKIGKLKSLTQPAFQAGRIEDESKRRQQ